MLTETRPVIRRLSNQVANQIAAGEVLERPANAVKELVENSLDAGASEIHIDLAKPVWMGITVRDNGVGIAKADLPLALAAHATSKLHTIEDLSSLHTMGFRGEALASMAAASQLTLSSRQVDEPNGWQVVLNGDDQRPTVRPCSLPVGTTVELRQLFYNTPARRKFLRSFRTEWLHVEEMLKRLMLSRFDVAFHVNYQDRTVWQLPAATSEAAKEVRLSKLFSKAFCQQAIHVSAQRAGMTLTGWIGPPEYHRSSTDWQLFYLNGRVVRDRLLTRAVREAYGDAVYPGRQPVYCLYLCVSPEQVDVNVHPTKHEVRFAEPNMIYDYLVSSLMKHLKTGKLGTDLEETVCEQRRDPSSLVFETVSQAPLSSSQPPERDHILQQQSRASSPWQAHHGPSNQLPDGLRWLGVLQQKNWLLEVSDGLLMIAICPALTYYYRQAMAASLLRPKPLAVPVQVPLAPKVAEVLSQTPDLLEPFGLTWSMAGQAVLMVRAIPAGLPVFEVESMLRELFHVQASSSITVGYVAQHYALWHTEGAPGLMDASRLLSMTPWQELIRVRVGGANVARLVAVV